MLNKIHYLKSFIKRSSLLDGRLAWLQCVKAGYRQICFDVRPNRPGLEGRRQASDRAAGKRAIASAERRTRSAQRGRRIEDLATDRERAYNQVPLEAPTSLSRGKPCSTKLFWRLPRGLPAALRRSTNVLRVVDPRVLPKACMSETKLSKGLRETIGDGLRPWGLKKVPPGLRPGLSSAGRAPLSRSPTLIDVAVGKRATGRQASERLGGWTATDRAEGALPAGGLPSALRPIASAGRRTPSAERPTPSAQRPTQHRERVAPAAPWARELPSRGVLRRPVNMVKVILSLSEMGFCDRAGNPKPNFRYFQESQQSSIARVSSVLRGLSFYYYLANSKRRCMERCSYILTHSLAMMFAAKFKLGTRAKVFYLAGRNLHRPLSSLKRKPRA